jgi:hypothetical protein
MEDIRELFDKAIKSYASETPSLEFLPLARYNKRIFFTTGQYDWFSGEALYCLIRYQKPETVLEISTSSGYSTLFMAKALKENNKGTIYTYEIDRTVANKAKEVFRVYNVANFIKVIIGDALKTAEKTKVDFDLLFLDSLHTENFARWFIEKFVLHAKDDVLFHVHDVMPVTARVRCWDAPPVKGTPLESSIFKLIKKCLHLDKRDDELIDIMAYPPENEEGLPTYDGNRTTEAVFINSLAQKMNSRYCLYCHEIADDYPELSPRKFDSEVIGRQNKYGKPCEWNESFWCFAGALRQVYGI